MLIVHNGQSWVQFNKKPYYEIYVDSALLLTTIQFLASSLFNETFNCLSIEILTAYDSVLRNKIKDSGTIEDELTDLEMCSNFINKMFGDDIAFSTIVQLFLEHRKITISINNRMVTQPTTSHCHEKMFIILKWMFYSLDYKKIKFEKWISTITLTYRLRRLIPLQIPLSTHFVSGF